MRTTGRKKIKSLSKNDEIANFLERMDGWESALTGLGVYGRDKTMEARPKPVFLNEMQAQDFYQADEIAAKVVDLLPEEMTREGFDVSTADKGFKDLTESTQAWMDENEIEFKFEKAMNWARLYGGAAIVVGLADGLSTELPVDYSKIKKIEYLTVLQRHDFSSQSYVEIEKDVRSPNFGSPVFYEVAPEYKMEGTKKQAARIHHSRVIRFIGDPVNGHNESHVEYWGNSVLSRLYSAIMQFQMAYKTANFVMQDMAKLIVKINGLRTILSQGDDKYLARRVRALSMQSSAINACVLDSEGGEDAETKMTNLTGIPDLLKRFDAKLVSATGMPHTILLGEGATGGIGNKGEGEKRDWYDKVKAAQEKVYRPKLKAFLKMVYASKDGPTKGKVPQRFLINFNPLWLPTEKEIAETRKIQSETDKNYFEMDVLGSDEIAQSRFGGGQYSMETKIDFSSRREIENAKESDPSQPEEI